MSRIARQQSPVPPHVVAGVQGGLLNEGHVHQHCHQDHHGRDCVSFPGGEWREWK